MVFKTQSCKIKWEETAKKTNLKAQAHMRKRKKIQKTKFKMNK